MKLFKIMVSILLVLQQSVSSFAAAEDVNQSLNEQSKNSVQMIMDLGEVTKGTQISVTEIPDATQENLAEFINDKQNRNSDILLSTDNEKTFVTVAGAVQKNKIGRIFKFIPIGKLAAQEEKITSGWKTYVSNVKKTILTDKIGLTVVVFTTAVDSLVWIHSGSLDIHQKSAMVLMNIIFAASFGLDRDLWSRMTVPLRHRIMSTLEKYGEKVMPKESTQALIASQFLSNLAFSVGFQFLRRSVLSMDQIHSVLQTSEFWIKSIEVGALVTLTSFAWGELGAKADSVKQPVAKNSLKRFADFRNVILAQTASIGMVLQPAIYGYSPMAVSLIVGGVGLIALINSNRIINMLEGHKVTKTVYKHQMILEDVLNETLRLKARMSCEMLFAM